MRFFHRQVSILVVIGLLLSFSSHANTFQIDPNTSVLKFSIPPTFFAPGPPVANTELNLPLSGLFDFAVTPAPSYYVDKTIADTTSMSNINVPTSIGQSTWFFPALNGYVRTDGVVFSDDGCAWMAITGTGGSCWAAGPSVGYTGTFDGTHLVIDGGRSLSSNNYSYHIEATVVPEPSSTLMMCIGLCAVVLGARRQRIHLTR